MPTRTMYCLSFVIITSLLLFSLYLQFFQGFEPCPLCTMQRISFLLLGIIFFVGMFISKRGGQVIINTFALLTSGLGIFFSGRQIWLQHFPSAASNECGVSLEYMMRVLPLNQVMQKILSGSAECRKAGWEFFYLNMAEWSLIMFIGFALLSVYLSLRKA